MVKGIERFCFLCLCLCPFLLIAGSLLWEAPTAHAQGDGVTRFKALTTGGDITAGGDVAVNGGDIRGPADAPLYLRAGAGRSMHFIGPSTQAFYIHTDGHLYFNVGLYGTGQQFGASNSRWANVFSTNGDFAGTLAVGGGSTLTGDLAVNGGDITTSSGTFNLATSANTVVVGNTGATGGNILRIGSSSVTVGPRLEIRSAVTSNPDIAFFRGNYRWLLRILDTESGGNTGASFNISAYNDAGSPIDVPVSIARAAGGAITLARPVTVTGDLTTSNIKGAAGADLFLTPSANQSLHFKDNTGATHLSILPGVSSFASKARPDSTANNRDLGDASYKWRDLYLAGVITAGSGSTVLTNANGTLKRSALDRHNTFWIPPGLDPAASGGCAARALDADGNPGQVFNQGQIGYTSGPLPLDFDGSVEDFTVYFAGTTGATVWTFKFRVIGDGDAETAAWSGLTAYSTPTETPGSTAAQVAQVATPSGCLGAAGNAGKRYTVQVTLTTGAAGTIFRGARLEY